MSESYISKLHYADLQGKFSVEGNNLDIVETLAIYICVPEKFSNDGNGKKALWRKSLDDTVKKLMISKENNTLSASQLRNSAYKNHIGSFTSDELYNPEMARSDDEESVSNAMASDVRKIWFDGNKDEARSPMHDTSNSYAANDEQYVMSDTKNAKDKYNIKSKLEHMFSRSNVGNTKIGWK
jgi:hypothetical protein